MGAPFFSDPYFGLAITNILSSSMPSASYVGCCSEMNWPKSPMIEPRFLPVVIMPQPPIEWKRTAIAPSGSSDGVSLLITA